MVNGGAAVETPAAARSVIRVPEDFSTIQAAVDAAKAGDTIAVGPGSYCEHVLIEGKADLRLHSAAGANRAVITGNCPAVERLGYGIHVMNATGIDIQGFVVEYFEYGIWLMAAHGSRVHLNEARFIDTVVRTGVAAGSRGFGILLSAGSGHNTISQNDLHDNGRNGILLTASSGNTVRANKLRNNNTDNLFGTCNLMVNAGSSDNTIAENEIVGSYGVGIMIGPGLAITTGNRIMQNRISGFAGPGIIAMATAAGNVIEQNDARGNGLSYAAPQNVDLFDWTQPTDNTWKSNLGTCGPGVC